MAILVPFDPLNSEKATSFVANSHLLQQTMHRIPKFFIGIEHALAVILVPPIKDLAIICIFEVPVNLREIKFEILNLRRLAHEVQKNDFEDGAIETLKIRNLLYINTKIHVNLIE